MLTGKSLKVSSADFALSTFVENLAVLLVQLLRLSPRVNPNRSPAPQAVHCQKQRWACRLLLADYRGALLQSPQSEQCQQMLRSTGPVVESWSTPVAQTEVEATQRKTPFPNLLGRALEKAPHLVRLQSSNLDLFVSSFADEPQFSYFSSLEQLAGYRRSAH